MENNLDKLFKSKLGGQEPDFHPAAWDRMERLLDEEGMVPIQKKKRKKSRAIYLSLMIIGFALSILGYESIKQQYGTGEGSNLANSDISKSTIDNKVNSENRPVTKNITTIKSESNTSLAKESNTSLAKASNTTLATAQKQNESSTPLVYSINKTAIENQSSKQRILSNNNASPTRSSQKEHINGISEQTKNRAFYDDPISEDISRINETDIDEKAKENRSLEFNKKPAKRDILKNENGINSTLVPVASLDIMKGQLLIPNRLITPQIQMLKASLFDLGVQSSVRFGDGFGYSIGPYISYNMGKGYSIELGGQFDAQNFETGAKMSVFDKVYSFGSTLNERTFTLSNQKSFRLPLTMTKEIYGFDLYTGLIFNKVITTEGIIADAPDVPTAESTRIGSEMIKSTNFSFQIGASLSLNRYFDLSIGVEYRPRKFVEDQSIADNPNRLYPSLGLRYKLFKF